MQPPLISPAFARILVSASLTRRDHGPRTANRACTQGA
ncbi:hypothetical protein FH063_002654 [Azospirillum argentinense]|uniref:Uncharacterized protein n=1 Tax=Azospirillum argentinense TaxID=2970906 RepID=A0A5B0KP80_9PROT|nr:hypothetical protein FH063_002654 [Azospirillum argentinense]